VLDVGGGDGRDALPLSSEGHHVTLVDFSAHMLAEARRRAEAQHLAEHMTFHQAPLSALPSLFAPASFDLVLCHSVLHYLDDVGRAIQELHDVVRPAGLLSVLSLNRYAEAYRQALLLLDPVAARAALDTTTFTNLRFGGVAVHMSTTDDTIHHLEGAGCSIVGQYGARCACDYMPNNDLKRDPTFFSQLEQPDDAKVLSPVRRGPTEKF
jgi:S-adenosylmethionine-dependent methyltransferase